MIYTSSIPALPVQSRAVFTHLFNAPSSFPTPSYPRQSLVGAFPASAPAFIDAETGKTISRAELKVLALTFAYGIRAHHSLRRGDTILIFSPNSLLYPILLHATTAAGLRATLANSAYTPAELAHQWTDSRAKVAFVHPALIDVARKMLISVGVSRQEADRKIVVLSTEWLTGAKDEAGSQGLVQVQTLLTYGRLQEEEKFEGKDADETVYLCYSSGTTGKPKGVETTHRNMTSVLDILKPAFPPVQHGKDVMLGVLPFYHIYGAVKNLHFPFLSGLPVVIMSRFDPAKFCAHIEHYRVTNSLIVPPILLALTRHPAVEKHNMSSLRFFASGAAPLGADLVKAVTERFSRVGANIRIIQGYGLTETSPTTHLLPIDDSFRKVGSIGILLPNLEARIVDVDTEVDASQGERGELWIRGPIIMKGYLNNPTATANAITPDGWFRTGDVAIRDKEGFYTIVDRRKELIKYKGFQVPPAELESVLLTHPDVADAAVIGIDSPAEATELPRAYVVHAHPDTVASPAAKEAFGKQVQTWIQSRVARHKYLRGGVIVVDIIPKSAAGKILRRELRERAKKEVGGSAKAKL